jgi:CheY-like chemotaxis protein
VRVHSLEARAERPAGVRAALSGVNILVVEDDPRLREGLRELLENLQAEVRAVGDAGEALAHLAAGWPEVLVSDIGLPDLDGYELVRRARALPSGGRLAAVALTGCTTPPERARALAAGFDVHLGKPVEPARLLEAISVLLRTPAAARAAPSSAG